jgi:hypothetical protein
MADDEDNCGWLPTGTIVVADDGLQWTELLPTGNIVMDGRGLPWMIVNRGPWAVLDDNVVGGRRGGISTIIGTSMDGRWEEFLG